METVKVWLTFFYSATTFSLAYRIFFDPDPIKIAYDIAFIIVFVSIHFLIQLVDGSFAKHISTPAAEFLAWIFFGITAWILKPVRSKYEAREENYQRIIKGLQEQLGQEKHLDQQWEPAREEYYQQMIKELQKKLKQRSQPATIYGEDFDQDII